MNLLANPWLLLGVALFYFGSVGGSFFYGQHVGANGCKVKWMTREAKIQSDMSSAMTEAQKRVLEAERKSTEDIAAVSATYQQKLEGVRREKTIAVDAARRSGLFVDTVGAAHCADTTPAISTGPGGRDGATRSELSETAIDFFISEATRADEITEQLTACQNVLIAERKNETRN